MKIRSRSYPSFARDSTMPSHQIHRAIGQRLRLCNETLNHIIIRINNGDRHHQTNHYDENHPTKLISKALVQIKSQSGDERKKLTTAIGRNRETIRTCGWFLRQDLRSSARRPRAIPDIFSVQSFSLRLLQCASIYSIPSKKKKSLVHNFGEGLTRFDTAASFYHGRRSGFLH